MAAFVKELATAMAVLTLGEAEHYRVDQEEIDGDNIVQQPAA